MGPFLNQSHAKVLSITCKEELHPHVSLISVAGKYIQQQDLREGHANILLHKCSFLLLKLMSSPLATLLDLLGNII